MSFTTQDLDLSPMPTGAPPRASELDLPVREFSGYDKNGTTTITGSPIQHNAKQPHTTEALPEPEAAPKEESVALSPKISALARKEQAHRRNEQLLKEERKNFAQKLADADAYAKLKERIAAKDYAAADELGMSHEEYTQYLIKKHAGEDPNEQRYRKVESELETIKKNEEDRITRDYEQNQSLWKQEIKKTVDSDDRFSAIKKLGAHDAVLQHINDSFDEDDVALTVEQAAVEINGALREKAKLFSSVLDEPGSSSDAPRTLGPPKTSPKTITNQMAQTSVKSANKPFHLLSESEQLAEAIRRVQAAKVSR